MFKTSRKSIFAFFTIIFMFSLFLVGCSSDDTSKDDNKNNDDNQEEVTINVLTQSLEPTELLEKFYEEYPHIKVQWDQVDTANISQTLKTRLAAGGESLDIVTPQRSDYEVLGESGAFVDLSGEDFLANYDSVAIEAGKVGDKLYGIPLTQQAYLVWYNKDLFNEYGLEVPTNWEEFLATAKTLKENDVPPIVLPGKDGWILNVFAGLPYSGLFSEEANWLEKAAAGEVKWTDEGSVESLKKLKLLVDEGYLLDGAIGTGYDQAYQAFYQEKAAMLVNGAWSIDLIANNTPSFEVGAFVPPGNEEGQGLKVAYTPGNTISVASASKNKEAALTFLNFLSQPENASIFATTIKQFSSVKGSTADFHPATKIVSPIFDNEKSNMLHAHVSPSVNSIIAIELQKLIVGEKSPEEVAEALQEAQEKDLK